jgi:hypothetical protein
MVSFTNIFLRLPPYLLFFLKSYLEGRTFTVHINDDLCGSTKSANSKTSAHDKYEDKEFASIYTFSRL